MSVIPTSAAPLRRRMNMIRARWYRLVAAARDPYRPELHYMRGPGPKWREKHAPAYARVSYGHGELVPISIRRSV